MLRRTRALALPLAAALFACGAARAQRLPIRTLDVADGLPTSRVNCLLHDSRGFLWIGSWEGLACFDGERLTSYGKADGLPASYIQALAEGRDGTLWVGTKSGLARLDEHARSGPRFEPVGADESVFSAFVDSRGELWFGTPRGLLRARSPNGSAWSPELARAGAQVDWPRLADEDEHGRDWFGAQTELLEFAGDAPQVHALPRGADLGEMIALRCRGPDVYVAFDHGVLRLSRDPSGGGERWERVDLELRPDQLVRALLFDSRGRTWIGTSEGLIERSADGTRTLDASNGFSDAHVRDLVEDRQHDVWIATWSGGVCRLPPNPLESWSRANGLPSSVVLHSAETVSGAVLVNTTRGIARLDASGLRVLDATREPGFGAPSYVLLRDRADGFWVDRGEQLWRFAGPEPDFAAGVRVPLAGDARFLGLLVEDADASLWANASDHALYHLVGSAQGWSATRVPLAEPRSEHARALLRTRAGLLVAGGAEGLERLEGARFVRPATRGEPVRNVRSLLEDAHGTLWIGTRADGVWRCADIGAPEPTVERASSAPEARELAVWTMIEDRRGRICLGTARGLWRLDPASGALESLTPREGLPGSIVSELRRGTDGALWISTSGGIARLSDAEEAPSDDPPGVLLCAITAGGVARALPARGTREEDLGELESGQDNLEIRFVAPCLGARAAARVVYRLQGADAGWSEPRTERSVSYAHLGAGTYRFEVCAVSADGARGVPATLDFAILPPLWRRSWFLAGCALLACAAAWTAHRARVRRLLALEALRRQIAADVHDDVGAGLAEVAILAEVARRKAGGAAQGELEEVARLARRMRESMSDIVWAVDPRRDTLGELVQRVRQSAFNLFSDESVHFELRAPDEGALGGTPLPPDLRRHLLLACKELLANAARHAQATRVELVLALAPGRLELCVSDDGRGFDPLARRGGHGLEALAQRASAVRGRVEIDSGPGRGTRVRLFVPLSSPA